MRHRRLKGQRCVICSVQSQNAVTVYFTSILLQLLHFALAEQSIDNAHLTNSADDMHDILIIQIS